MELQFRLEEDVKVKEWHWSRCRGERSNIDDEEGSVTERERGIHISELHDAGKYIKKGDCSD